jgi:hypothetical protein
MKKKVSFGTKTIFSLSVMFLILAFVDKDYSTFFSLWSAICGIGAIIAEILETIEYKRFSCSEFPNNYHKQQHVQKKSPRTR